MSSAFIMLPKGLLESNLSCEGILLYSLMLDRLQLSEKNGWKDDEGRAYIYFTVKEIKGYFNWGYQKITKVFSELEAHKLITRKKQGLGKPSKIYVNEVVGKSNVRSNENQKSRHSKIKSQDIPKSDTNNTDINNTYKSNTDNNLSYHSRMDWIEKRKAFKNLIKENINYEACAEKYGKGWCDEIVDIMTETVISDMPYIKIGGTDYPHEVVKSRFLKINDMHIEYIHDALSENKSPVRNIRAYLITTIFRARETMENRYMAKVNYDSV